MGRDWCLVRVLGWFEDVLNEGEGGILRFLPDFVHL